jgi:carotenoid cleavage oxygenase
MTNRFLEGAFAPMQKEYTLTDLEVTGTIPDYLDGRYLRNGPNPIGEIDPELYHWFIGDGMVHGIRIRDGKAEWYRNRWVRGPLAARKLGEKAHIGYSGRYAVSEVGPNTNVIGHAGKTLALNEFGNGNYELNEELDTVGECTFDGTLYGGWTAHPLRDPVSGELHAVSYTMHRGNTVQYSVITADGRARRNIDIEVTGSPMMHAFSLTERYIVLYDLPVTFDAGQAASMIAPRGLRLPARLVLSALIGRVRIPDPIAALQPRPKDSDRRFPYSWNPRYPARVGVMPREGDNADVRWFDVEPCGLFHPMNAYDEGDTIVLDIARHPKLFDTKARKDVMADNHFGPVEGLPTLDRWTIDLADGKVRESRINDRPVEFPRVDERLVGKRHRYGYAPTLVESTSPVFMDEVLIKQDFVGDTTQSRSFGAGKAVGEFVFHPSSPEAAEDEGVLMGFVYDQVTDRSELAILDAQTLQSVASIQLPHRVPVGFHGNWIPTSAA